MTGLAVVVTGEVDVSPHDSLTGPIHVVLGERPFPSNDWDDFIGHLLSMWVAATTRLLVSASREEELGFMDGPFRVDVTVKRPRWLEARAIEGRVHGDVVVAKSNFDLLAWTASLVDALALVAGAAPAREREWMRAAVADLQPRVEPPVRRHGPRR